MYYVVVLYVLAALYLVAFLLYGIIKGGFIKLFFLNGLSGLLIMLIFNLAESYFGMVIKVNYVSVLLSSVLGVPGFGLYLFNNYFFT